jgi:hypothetical protein
MALLEINAAITGARHALDVLKNLFALSTDAKVNQAIIETQSTILDMQSKLTDAKMKYEELAEAKKALERQLADQSKWEEEARRYELTDIGETRFVYGLNMNLSNGEPSHCLCPRCFGNRKKCILTRDPGNDFFVSCGCGFAVKYPR